MGRQCSQIDSGTAADAPSCSDSVVLPDAWNGAFWSLLQPTLGRSAALAFAVIVSAALGFLVARRRTDITGGLAVLIPVALLVSPHGSVSWGLWLGAIFVFRPSLPWMVFSGAMAATLLSPSRELWIHIVEYAVLLIVPASQTLGLILKGRRPPRHDPTFSV